MLSRREILKVTLAALASISAAPTARADGARPAKAPRYVLQLVFGGGLDSIFSTDPKERSEVDADVDVPYAPSDIHTVGRSRFGPHFAPLMKWAPRMTIINGVFVGVANHPAAMRQLLRMRLGANNDMPTMLEVIGAQRDGQPLPCVTLEGITDGSANSLMGDAVFEALDKASPDELMMMARVARTRGKGLLPNSTATATHTSIEDTAAFFERLANTPRFQPKTPTPPDVLLQRAVWLFQHDLTRCATVSVGGAWDTHYLNTKIQTALTLPAFAAVAEMLNQLQSTNNAHGSLLDNTLILMSSELGRHPLMNPRDGKDHFPEMPVIILKPGTGGEVFGRTGRRRQALPFPKMNNGQVTLTDVGTSILRIAGVTPETRGYAGTPLEFLGA